MTTPDDLPRDPALSTLYREQCPAEPPAALDAAILGAARQALTLPRRPWWQRLQTPVALAATVTLAVMLTLTMDRNPPQAEFPAPAAAPQPAAAEPGAKAKSTADLAQPTHQAAKPAKDDRATSKQEFAPATPSAAPKASEYRPAPRALASDNASPPAERAKASGSMEADQPKLLAAPPMPAAASPSAPEASRAAARSRGEAQLLSAEEWISRIRQLRQQGKTAEAAAQWLAFRKAYPDYPLPDDLRDSP